MPSKGELALRILIAMVLGGAIGLERELKDKSAGLRTHISVALGCALFGMISAYSWDYVGHLPRNDSSYQVDVTRIASTMVTGIGFLGGGAILKHGATVRGLTTAGSLWVTAAIGLGVGLGEFYISTITTAALLFALVGLRRPAHWLERRFAQDHERVVLRLTREGEPGDVIDALRHLRGVDVTSVSVRQLDDQLVVQADVVARHRGIDVEALLGPVLERDDVTDAEIN